MIPFGPGGGSDTSARILVDVAKKYCSQPIIIVNRPGASGTRCIYELTQSKPDGYTTAYPSNSEGCSALHLIPAKYTLDSYEVISSVDSRSPVVVTKGSWNSLEELIAFAKKNPGKVSAGVPGLGTVARLCGEWLGIEAKAEWKIVPFQGSGPVIPALLGGHVDIAFLWPDVVMGLYKSGELKVLCSISEERSKIMPNVPTSKEYGFNVSGGSRHFVIVPNGVPKPIKEKLHGIIKNVVQDPEFIKRLAALGNNAYYETPDKSTAFLKEWYKTTEGLYKKLGMLKKN
jgi:tripartite-type tricarboxylate transporter receptor subunit TctC